MCATPASDRVLNTAAELFYRHGVRAVGVDAVIAESGVAKMTLYKHFASKDALVAAALGQHDERFRAWFLESLAAAGEEPRARLLAVFDVLAAWFTRPDFRGSPFLNAAVELADPAHPARAVVSRHREWLRGLILDLARSARLREPECTAEALVLLAEGAIVSAQVGGGSPAAAARCAARTVIEARSPRGGARSARKVKVARARAGATKAAGRLR